jgi:hypothetical protein
MGLTRTSLSGSSWNFSWIQKTKLEAPSSPDSLLSSRMDEIPRGLDQWLMSFHEIENLMPMKEPGDKTRMFRTLLKGQALSYFEHHLIRRLEAEDSEHPDNELIELVLRDVGLEYIPKRAIHVQNYYLRQQRGNKWVMIHPYNNL